MKTKLVALSAVLMSLVAVPAQATVDAIIQYNIPYRSIQTDDICFMRLPVYTSVGIPQAVLTEASLAPTQILKDFPRRTYVNLNLAATARPMVHTYVSDSTTATGVWEYTMKLDVSALSTYNGTTLAGRSATYKSAKLALLAIARNMDDISNGNYRLKVTFVGLPAATSVPGSKLNATTAYPYTATSPLLIAYERELIDVEGSCPEL